MFQIDNSTALAVMPTPAAAGTPGWFTKGDPVGGVPATIVTDDFLNMVQAELMAIMTAGGVTPSKTTTNQILVALKAVFVQTTAFTGSNQALAASGFQNLPGGLKLQWFKAAHTAGANGNQSVNLPFAFPSSHLNTQVTENAAVSAGAAVWSVSGATLTNITLFWNYSSVTGGTTARNCYALCIGT